MFNFREILALSIELFYAIVDIVKELLISFYNVVVPARFRSKDVAGEIVLITGGGSGLGRLMAIKFAKLGATVVIWDINKDGNEETASEIRSFGGRVFSYVCDLSSRENIYEVSEKVKEDVGDVDILVNNAGIVTGKKFLQCPDHLIEKTMAVNTSAHFWTSKSFLPKMLSRNHGHLVTIASAAGYFGCSGLADYCASKFAAVGFNESIREEMISLSKDGVHTTAVCPFFIATGMFDGVKSRFNSILPILEPEYAANKIMEAVLTNQEVLMMPRLLYFMYPLRSFLPVRCGAVINRYCGGYDLMENFRGRQRKEE